MTTETPINPDNPMAAQTPPPSHAPIEPRTDLDLNYFRQRLMDEKALAEQTIRGTQAAEEDGTGALGMNRNELTDYDDDHPADLGTDLQLQEQDMALIKNAQDILSRIARAQQKMDEGTYGVCDRTHKPIPVERLEAIPYATLSVEAQAIQEIT